MKQVARLSLKLKFALAVTLFTTLVTIILATLYLQRSAQEDRQSFITGQELFAQVFSDGALRYLESDRQSDLDVLARTTVLGNYLYAQVVRGDQVLVEEEAPRAEGASLPLIADLSKTQATVRQLPNGQHYLDIVRSFSISAGSESSSAGGTMQQGYVRIGVSLAPLESQLTSQTLTVAALAAGLVLFIFGLSWAVGWLLFRGERAAMPAALRETTLSVPTVAAAAVMADHMQIGSSQLCIDDATKKVTVRGNLLELSPKEYEVLKLLASAHGRVFSNDEILAQVWTGRDFASAQDVKQYIYFLRQKLEEDPEHPKLIVTVRGFGYKLTG
jgi:hypothetical protein